MTKDLQIITDKLKKIPHCEGIVFSGSRIEGDFVKNSDYDFTILVSEGKSYYKIFRYQKYLADVCVATFEIIKKKDLIRTKLSNAEMYIIASGQILYDKFGNMNKLQKEAKKIWAKGPKTSTTKKEAGYLCTTFLHKLEKDTDGTAWFSLNQIILKITELFFELNHAWLPKAFNVEKEMKKIDSGFFAIYKEIYCAVGSERVKAAAKLLKYLMKKFNLPQNEEVYIQK